MVNISAIRTAIDSRKTRSAWDRAVNAYAHELVDNLEDLGAACDITTQRDLRNALLNGAKGWHQYSWGGCSLCYNWQIAERCCTPSELKRTANGMKRPNAHEEWLDVQARALYQAADLICDIVKEG